MELVYLSISTKVSAKWKLVQSKVFRNQKTITSYALLDDESDGHVAPVDVEMEDLDTAGDAKVESEEADNEDNEDETQEEDSEGDEEEEEPEPEPVKPAVTSKVTKPRAKRGVQA